MALRWYTTVVDSRDVTALGRWWAETLGWTVAVETETEVLIVPPRAFDRTRSIPLDEQGPGLAFVSVPDDRVGKNRLHLDLAPGPDDDREAVVEALLDRGATRADVGQGDDVPWIVLRDPEGNEFCVLTSRG
ncbi:MAG: VOC family protein [Curtobacterium sp.]